MFRRSMLLTDHYWNQIVLAKEQRDDDDNIGPIYAAKKNGMPRPEI